MNKALMIRNLKRRFQKLNPEADPEVIDWEAYVDPNLTYWENLERLKEAYPQYRWEMPPEKEEEERYKWEELEFLQKRLQELKEELGLEEELEETTSSTIEGKYIPWDQYIKEMEFLRKEAERWMEEAERLRKSLKKALSTIEEMKKERYPKREIRLSTITREEIKKIWSEFKHSIRNSHFHEEEESHEEE